MKNGGSFFFFFVEPCGCHTHLRTHPPPPRGRNKNEACRHHALRQAEPGSDGRARQAGPVVRDGVLRDAPDGRLADHPQHAEDHPRLRGCRAPRHSAWPAVPMCALCLCPLLFLPQKRAHRPPIVNPRGNLIACSTGGSICGRVHAERNGHNFSIFAYFNDASSQYHLSTSSVWGGAKPINFLHQGVVRGASSVNGGWLRFGCLLFQRTPPYPGAPATPHRPASTTTCPAESRSGRGAPPPRARPRHPNRPTCPSRHGSPLPVGGFPFFLAPVLRIARAVAEYGVHDAPVPNGIPVPVV